MEWPAGVPSLAGIRGIRLVGVSLEKMEPAYHANVLGVRRLSLLFAGGHEDARLSVLHLCGRVLGVGNVAMGVVADRRQLCAAGVVAQNGAGGSHRVFRPLPDEYDVVPKLSYRQGRVLDCLETQQGAVRQVEGQVACAHDTFQRAGQQRLGPLRHAHRGDVLY